MVPNGGLAVAANAGAGEHAGGRPGEHGRAIFGVAATPWFGCGGTQIPPVVTPKAELRRQNSCNSVLYGLIALGCNGDNPVATCGTALCGILVATGRCTGFWMTLGRVILCCLSLVVSGEVGDDLN